MTNKFTIPSRTIDLDNPVDTSPYQFAGEIALLLLESYLNDGGQGGFELPPELMDTIYDIRDRLIRIEQILEQLPELLINAGQIQSRRDLINKINANTTFVSFYQGQFPAGIKNQATQRMLEATNDTLTLIEWGWADFSTVISSTITLEVMARKLNLEDEARKIVTGIANKYLNAIDPNLAPTSTNTPYKSLYARKKKMTEESQDLYNILTSGGGRGTSFYWKSGTTVFYEYCDGGPDQPWTPQVHRKVWGSDPLPKPMYPNQSSAVRARDVHKDRMLATQKELDAKRNEISAISSLTKEMELSREQVQKWISIIVHP